MKKFPFLAGAMLIAAPALAQTTTSPLPAPSTTSSADPAMPAVPVAPSTPAMPRPTMPAPTTQIPPTAPAAPMSTGTPTTPATPEAPMSTTAVPPSAAQPDAATPPAGDTAQATPAAPSDVASIVDRDFAGYDRNSNGSLNTVEFNRWMIALRTASDPTTSATSPATRAYLTNAFATADADHSRSVTKAELTTFLSQPPTS